ncbi:hypothetical protein [Herbidospora daliensis]|uniref:hypothetical protein n=1 Tax=Herbidospora daliensis TaxID=295585 RepID=UPI000781B24E|nr:hypothetical protein [Herbidospora daliensis]
MRPDLLALTPDSLAALTNKGLVKRATRELDAAAPALRTDPDGTVHGDFPDGPTASLPAGGLDGGRCTCAATGVCRHLIGLVLAYQRADQSPDVAADLPWSPGQVTDDELTARIGARSMAAARRAEKAGYTARVRRANAADPVPQVELATATVRFLVPGDLGFVHTDAADGSRDDALALAVWAFRAADERHPGLDDVRIDVGGAPEEGAGPGLERALGLAATVLREGATHLGAGFEAVVADTRRHLDEAGLRWPLLAVDDLADQLAAYHGRGAHYRPELLASHLAELHARHRAVTRPDATLRSSVLGTAEAAETPLRRARLDALGCRIRAIGGRRIAEVYLAHAASAGVFVLRRHWDDEEADGPALARRRIGATPLAALAAGNLVTESAVRSASRTVRLAAGRIAKTTVSPSRGLWDDLPSSILAADVAALARELDALPPRPIRPRIEAELVRVIPVAGVESIAYTPGDQRLDAVIADHAGTPATIAAVHTAAAPGRLDALAAALTGGHVRFVSGVVRRTAGTVVVEPIGLVAGDQLIVPDLREPAAVGLADAGEAAADPLTAALTEARDLLAEAAHRGLNHLPPTYGARLTTAAERLAAIGLRRIAGDVMAFAAARTEDAWVDAYLRLELALDLISP